MRYSRRQHTIRQIEALAEFKLLQDLFLVHNGDGDETEAEEKKEQLRRDLEFYSTLHRRHQSFKNNSAHAQRPVEFQLAVALYRFGRNGNGSSFLDVADRFGIAEGSVMIYTKRLVVAPTSLEEGQVSDLASRTRERSDKTKDTRTSWVFRNA
ncbi:hypothetical protein PsorP6_005838 [Peronosclerospora sorghi]|uniref:Uncharacterized protein n=1 Tax=Peronosclerospora sorghi TaxID=230839 RepID=A0ACC0W248_9STRA|nr:hypothetical protein PsorP6_005838 [Peronosclerospora sorghi]